MGINILLILVNDKLKKLRTNNACRNYWVVVAIFENDLSHMQNYHMHIQTAYDNESYLNEVRILEIMM